MLAQSTYMTTTTTTSQQIRRLSRTVASLSTRLDHLTEVVEDSLLTADEKAFLDEMFAKLKRGDSSAFVQVGRFPDGTHAHA